MGIFNRILLSFLLASALVLLLAMEAVQSETFARLVHERLVRARLAPSGMDVDFRSFRISLVPLATSVTDVDVRLPGKGAGGSFDRVSFKLDFFDLLQSRVHISELLAEDGEFAVAGGAAGGEAGGAAGGGGLAPVIGRALDDVDGIVGALPFTIGRIAVRGVSFASDGLAVRVVDAGLAYREGGVDVEASLADIARGKDGRGGRIDGARAAARVTGEDIVFDELVVRSGESSVSGRGRLVLGDGSYRGSARGSARVADLRRLPGARGPLLASLDEGRATFEGEVGWDGSPFFDGDAAVEGLVSRHGSLRSLRARVRLEDGRLEASAVEAETPGGGTVSAGAPVVIDPGAGPGARALGPGPVPVRLERVGTREALAFLGDRLEPLDALVTGEVVVSRDGGELVFGLPGGLEVHRARLTAGGSEILSLRDLGVSGEGFRHDLASGVFSVNADLAMGGETIPVEGSVGAGRADVGFRDAAPDLGDVGAIAGVRVRGRARGLSFRVHGPLEDASIDARGGGTGLGVGRYRLGDADFDVSHRIATGLLEARSFRSLDPESLLSAKGSFDLPGRRMDADFDVERMNYPALERALGDHLPGFLRGVAGWNFIASGTASVKAHFTRGAESVRARAELESMTYRGEGFPRASFDLSIDPATVALSRVVLSKGGGGARGGLTLDRRTGRLAYDLLIEGAALSSFDRYRALGTGLEGLVEGRVSGEGTAPDVAGTASLRLAGARVGNRAVPEPSLEAEWGRGSLSASWDLFDGGIRGEAALDFRDGGRRPSQISADARMGDLSPLFAALSRRGAGPVLGGSLAGSLSASFPLADPSRLDLDLRIPEAALTHQGGYGDGVVRGAPGSAVRIDGGRIIEWSVRAGGDVTAFASSGRGDLGGRFSVRNEWTLDPNLLRALAPGFSATGGVVTGETEVAGGGGAAAVTGRASGRRLAFSLAGLPSVFEDVDFDVTVTDGRIGIDNLSGTYGRGGFRGGGAVELALPHPRAGLDLTFSNINHPLYQRSNLIASGDLSLRGDAPPYALSGRASLDRVTFRDDLTELTKDGGRSHSWSRHLPRRRAAAGRWIDLDLHIHGGESVEIMNNVVNAVLSTDLRVRGDAGAPLVSGSVEALPASSKMYFKGHEFSLDSGRIDFRDSETGTRPPFVRIEGNSTIDAHRVFLSVVGGNDDLEVGLRSEPGLSQKDILSLIAFGYTPEATQDLDEEQRQFLTTMSLGSFFIDQLNIGRGASDRMGLRLSIAPELDDNEAEDLIENRISEAKGVRTHRSLTRLRLSSDIGRRTNVSVSSSMGVDNEQSQELSVDYSINDNVSVQGIYETVSGEPRVQQTNSFGGDVKFRWIFGD